MPILYEDELCGESYKVRLMLSLIGIEYERRRVEQYPSRQHELPAFLAKSPLGELPVLEDDGLTLVDAHAILVYLAKRHRAPAWLGMADPADPFRPAEVQRWLGFGQRLSDEVFARRDTVLHGSDPVVAPPNPQTIRLLRVLDEVCWFNAATGTPFICATAYPTIADIACFAPVALLDEAQIDSADYPALARWVMRIKRLEGFTTMAGVYAAYA
jgi:glutathione S-transferase